MSEVLNTILPNLLKQLVADGKVTLEIAESAVNDATERGISLTTHLAQRQIINQSDLARYNSNEYGLSYVDLNSVEVPLDVSAMLSLDMLKKLQLVPIYRMGKALTVAVADPIYLAHISDIRFATELVPEPVIVE